MDPSMSDAAPATNKARVTMFSLLALAIALVVAALVGWAGSQGSHTLALPPLGQASVFVWCGVLAFLINWVVFIPAFIYQTERYFDLTGALTYLTVTGFALYMAPVRDPRALLIGLLVVIWAVRLGSFLFKRVLVNGFDHRFNHLKPVFARFLLTWTLQGLWVFLTLAAGLAVMTSTHQVPLGWVAGLGLLLWLAGFSIEAISDRQKRIFRADPQNAEKFIHTGLWAWSRHPNYFGEILLWIGVAVIALPVLSGWRWAMLVSPVFVYLLLTRISGVPLLEAHGEKKWGDDPAYRRYVDNTPALMMRPPRSA